MSIHPLFGGRWIARYWKWLRDRDEKRARLQAAKLAVIVVITEELLRDSSPTTRGRSDCGVRGGNGVR